MTIPTTLADKLALWRGSGQVAKYSHGLFLEPSWVAVYLGQGIVPTGWDPRADMPEAGGLDRALGSLARAIGDRVAAMPLHDAALARLA